MEDSPDLHPILVVRVGPAPSRHQSPVGRLTLLAHLRVIIVGVPRDPSEPLLGEVPTTEELRYDRRHWRESVPQPAGSRPTQPLRPDAVSRRTTSRATRT